VSLKDKIIKNTLNTNNSIGEVPMKKRTRSLLEEINSISPNRDRTQLLESRGVNAISSIIHLLEMIDQNYDSEIAQDLQKRVMLSIKNRDADRFMRGVKRLRGSK
jgi:hypothetical protein